MTTNKGQQIDAFIDELDRKLEKSNLSPEDPEVSAAILDGLTKRGLVGASDLEAALMDIQLRQITIDAAREPSQHDREPDVDFPSHWTEGN